MRFLYNLLVYLLAPVWGVWMWRRTRARREGPNWGERFGHLALPAAKGPRVWFHAVSVGEVVAALPILSELRARMPDADVVLSVTTSSGHQTARERAAPFVDHLIYFPLDLWHVQRRAMRAVAPQVLAVMETELWMNFLHEGKRRGAKTLLVNGRISDRSFRGSKRVAAFYRALLAALDAALMQGGKDEERIRALGARSTQVLGNCKFDQAVEGLDADPAAWRRELGLKEGKPVVVVGSTRGEDEEIFVLEALRRVGLDRVQVVHAPRHLERAEPLAARLGGAARRSLGEQGPYLLLDTYGELAKVYAVADVAIIGGGFGDYGGQNLIQPLAHGVPVLHGPHMQNFREAAALAGEAGAALVCATPEELASTLQRLLDDPGERKQRGEAGAAWVRSNLGASARYAEAIVAAIRPSAGT